MAQSLESAYEFLNEWKKSRPLTTEETEIAIFPSYPHLGPCVTRIREMNLNLRVGAQDCSTEALGAFTGEVSAKMCAEAGCRYVIVGHSERRERAHETNETLSKKFGQVLSADLIPVFCVGETEEQRDADRVIPTLKKQIEAITSHLSSSIQYVIAYEPVWAIGSGRTPTTAEIQEVHSWLREQLPSALGILYGGSVKPANAQEIAGIPHVDGFLVGGASLKAADFKKIVDSSI